MDGFQLYKCMTIGAWKNYISDRKRINNYWFKSLYIVNVYIFISCAQKACVFHIKFINQDYWISLIYESILNQFSWNFTHTIFHSCRHYPEVVLSIVEVRPFDM